MNNQFVEFILDYSNNRKKDFYTSVAFGLGSIGCLVMCHYLYQFTTFNNPDEPAKQAIVMYSSLLGTGTYDELFMVSGIFSLLFILLIIVIYFDVE